MYFKEYFAKVFMSFHKVRFLSLNNVCLAFWFSLFTQRDSFFLIHIVNVLLTAPLGCPMRHQLLLNARFPSTDKCFLRESVFGRG